MDFQIHTTESAPPSSQSTLDHVKRAFGFVPNILGVLAESPAALEMYVSASKAFDQSELTPLERQVVLMAASRENGCDYCLAAHSMAAKAAGASDTTVLALRNGLPADDNRLEVLRRFTQAVVRKRGWVASDDLAAFREAGFANGQMLDVVAGVALKTLSNYANHLTHPPIDEAFQRYAPVAQLESGTVADPCCV